MSAISDDDIELIDNIRKHRNELAHDLPKFITNINNKINVDLLGSIYELTTKVERWWIKEVHISTNPNFDDREVDDTDIRSGTMICMQMMFRIATEENTSVL
jgi:hypothetical protein